MLLSCHCCVNPHERDLVSGWETEHPLAAPLLLCLGEGEVCDGLELELAASCCLWGGLWSSTAAQVPAQPWGLWKLSVNSLSSWGLHALSEGLVPCSYWHSLKPWKQERSEGAR